MSKKQKDDDAASPAQASEAGGGQVVKSERVRAARRQGPQKRPRAKVGLGLLFILLLSAPPFTPSALTGRRAPADASAQTTQPLRKRQDIRAVEVSPDELKNLRHAFFMLKKAKPTCSDPSAKSEYDCWAAYHNNFDLYGCQHRIDLFWPWHRYHLAGFENALRNSDPANPDRVRDVTLPYWDWTQPPSGTNFPKSVEQKFLNPGEYYPEDCPDATQPCLNPLWADKRRGNSDCQSVKPACVQEALQLTTWREFGGGDRSGQIGDFELQAHNFMHASYIGGLMRNTTTAAQDPIFWLFHAYIDNVWDQWQKIHQANPCDPANVPTPTRALGGGDWPPKAVQFKDALCAKDLAYEYVTFGAPVIAALPSCPLPNSGCLTPTPVTPVSLSVASAARNFDSAELSLTGITVPSDFSYNALVLLHPRSAHYTTADKDFIDKYYATYFVAWRHPRHAHGEAGAHGATMDVQLDVTRKLKELAQGGGLNNLAATIVFSPSNAEEKATALVFRRDVNFVGASLIVKAGGKARTIQLNPTR
jgi:tyrosinase